MELGIVAAHDAPTHLVIEGVETRKWGLAPPSARASSFRHTAGADVFGENPRVSPPGRLHRG